MMRAFFAIAARSLRASYKRPVVLTFSLVQPLIWMLLFGPLFARTVDPSLDYPSYVTPGIVGLTLVFAASQAGVSWVRDAQTGFLLRLIHTETPAWVCLSGKLAGDAVRWGLQAAIVFSVGLISGARFSFHAGGLGALALLTLALVVTLSSLSTAVALATRQPELMGAYVHVINMPIVLTSSALVPRRHLPSFLADVGPYNPLSTFVDAARHVLSAEPPVDDLRLIVACAEAVLAIGFAHVLMQRLRSGDRAN